MPLDLIDFAQLTWGISKESTDLFNFDLYIGTAVNCYSFSFPCIFVLLFFFFFLLMDR